MYGTSISAGEIFEIEAASFRHQDIVAQLFGALRPALKLEGCKVHAAGTRVATSKHGLYTYPELVVVCGKPQFGQADPNALSNPKVIIEVLSPSTKDYDRGTKFELYRGLASLAEYIIVHQDAPYVEQHVRQPHGSWSLRDMRGIEAILRLASIPVEIPFAAVYEEIEFE